MQILETNWLAPQQLDPWLNEPTRISGNIRWDTLPIDAGWAHSLYKALFGQIENLISAKHLIIVTSGKVLELSPFAQLPFHVLVTSPLSKDLEVGSLGVVLAVEGRQRKMAVTH